MMTSVGEDGMELSRFDGTETGDAQVGKLSRAVAGQRRRWVRWEIGWQEERAGRVNKCT